MKPAGGESGIIIAEAAIILPIFVFVGLMLVDLQWMTRDVQALEYIASESARCEAIQSPACIAPNSPRSYAQQLAGNVHLVLTDPQIATPACSALTCTVTVFYDYKPFGVWFPSRTITRTGQAAK